MCAAAVELPSTPFRSAFTKLRKAIIGFICLPVSMENYVSLRKDFSEILYFSILFKNLSRKFKFH